MLRLSFLATAGMAVSTCVAPAADGTRRVTFAVTPARPLMDDRLTIKISGLPPHRSVTIRALSRAHDQRGWRSEAVFQSEPDGSIDLTAQAPLSGTYARADGMGLFWSMQPDRKPDRGDSAFFSIADYSAPVVTEIEAACDNRALGSVRVERRFAAPGIRAETVTAGGLAGALYRPGDGRRHPGVIILGGSEGGFDGLDAAMLASRGFVALSLGYFGANGLPRTLQKIPIEYFGKAVRWMRSLPEVDPDAIAMLGASRGAEAALTAASILPEVKAVVAISPSHVCWEGATGSQLPGGPAWTYGSKPLPYVPIRISLRFAAQYAWSAIARTPVALTPLFLENLASPEVAAAEIPVERIHGPVLLLCGDDDRVWPSWLMSGRIIERLRRSRRPYPDELLSYHGAGHWLPGAYLPTAGSRRRVKRQIGGTPEATARAQADGWPKIIRFLSTLSPR